ncbi:hypothetical protein [Ferrovibrio sp.]|uniref:hypothetical protein n=1 Tax=Ferrovibrio sp. TaxID=1917215 RepID=UPI00311D2DF7
MNSGKFLRELSTAELEAEDKRCRQNLWIMSNEIFRLAEFDATIGQTLKADRKERVYNVFNTIGTFCSLAGVALLAFTPIKEWWPPNPTKFGGITFWVTIGSGIPAGWSFLRLVQQRKLPESPMAAAHEVLKSEIVDLEKYTIHVRTALEARRRGASDEEIPDVTVTDLWSKPRLQVLPPI